MRLIAILDKKNYDVGLPYSDRTASRAIVFVGDKLLMVKSHVEGYYKFPGGGVNDGEDTIHALLREAKEEAGLVLDENSIKEYGDVIELRLSNSPKNKDCIFRHTSHYYICSYMSVGNTELEEDEAKLGFEPEIVDIDTAIAHNKQVMDKYYSTNIIRETTVLEDLKNNKK